MSGPERVVIVGGGVGGLATALAMGRAGHRVTLLEREPLPALAGPEEAFATERPGAPQAHQTHGFLARIVEVLNERFPDVLAALREAGCRALPPALNLGDPEPGDEDLTVLAMRRTSFTGTGDDGGAPPADPEARAMAAVFAAGATDPVIGRALARLWNLLDLPADLASRPEVVARMAAVMSDPDAYPPPPRLGPSRCELLALLESPEEATTHV